MKILIVDDDQQVRVALKRFLQGETGPDGRKFELTVCATPRAAVRTVHKDYFDVVITDMSMLDDSKRSGKKPRRGEEEPGAEGLQVVSGAVGRAPILIVLTAYANFENCVKAMRLGAWDYISKSANPIEAYGKISKSIAEAWEKRGALLTALQCRGDDAWIGENIGRLSKEHPGQFVAVIDKRVLAMAPSYRELDKQLSKALPYAVATIARLPEN